MKQEFKPTEFLTYTKSSKGITLAFLVITIIILLILAGTTIGMLTNKNGIFEKAKKATAEYANAVEKEQEELNSLFEIFEKDSSEIGGAYTAYSIGQEVTVGGESFYVFEPSNSKKSTVTLIAKYNLNEDGDAQLPNDNVGSDFYQSIMYENNWDYNYWDDECAKYTGWATKKFDLNKLSVGRDSPTDAIPKARLYALKIGGISGRLPTYEEIITLKDDYGDMIWGKANQVKIIDDDDIEKNANFLLYWTSSVKNTDTDPIFGSGYGNIYCVDGYYEEVFTEWFAAGGCSNPSTGVRPVITVPKTLVS